MGGGKDVSSSDERSDRDVPGPPSNIDDELMAPSQGDGIV
jgi:hypothetical protein